MRTHFPGMEMGFTHFLLWFVCHVLLFQTESPFSASLV
jgi:hypothetical protein